MSLQDKTFEYEGKTYKCHPSLDEFLRDAGFVKTSAFARISKAMFVAEIDDISVLLTLRLRDLLNMEGISQQSAEMIYRHSRVIRTQGSFVATMDQAENHEERYRYLPTGSKQLDYALIHPSSQFGWRTNTMVELSGPPGSGKTQLLYTTAIQAMKPIEIGGWDAKVLYIDASNQFNLPRLQEIADAHKFRITDQLSVAKVCNFDEVEMAFNDAIKLSQYGLIIIDDINSPIKSQYPTAGSDLCNLRPKQEHLHRMLSKLRDYALINNCLIMYANHMRRDMHSHIFADEFIPTGGLIQGHANTMRILLDKASRVWTSHQFSQDIRALPIRAIRAKITGCSFLPDCEGQFLIGSVGITHLDQDGLNEIMRFNGDRQGRIDEIEARIKDTYAKMYGLKPKTRAKRVVRSVN